VASQLVQKSKVIYGFPVDHSSAKGKRWPFINTPQSSGCHLPYGITQCYLPPNTSERTPPNPSQAYQNSINLSQRDGRLSSPRWLVTYPDCLTVRQWVKHPHSNTVIRDQS